MNKSEIIFKKPFLPSSNATKIMQPGKETFDFPASSVATQQAPVLGCRFATISPMRSNHLDILLRKALVEWIAVVSAVADQSLGQLLDKYFGESVSDKGDFMRRSRRCVDGERKTCAIRHCHELATFAPLGLSHSCAPFFATTKVPSMKHSLSSSPPRSFKSFASASSIKRSVPSRTHCWKRRWQVWYGGKRGGRSYQRAPLRNIHRMPLNTSRSSRRGRPRTTSGWGSRGSSKCHCSSLSSSRRGFLEPTALVAVLMAAMQPVLSHPF